MRSCSVVLLLSAGSSAILQQYGHCSASRDILQMPLLQSCDRNSKSLHNEQHIILAGHSSIQNRTGSFELLDHHHKTTPYDSWFASPECVGSKENSNDQFCLHTSNVFADFRGISILSKPQAAERILQLPAFAIEGVAGTVNDELDPPYSRQSLPGRGFGLLANRTLYRGDRIMSKTPLCASLFC